MTLDDRHARKHAPKMPKVLNLRDINRLSAGAGLDLKQNEDATTGQGFTPSALSGLPAAFSHAESTSKFGAANMTASKTQRQLPILKTDRSSTSNYLNAAISSRDLLQSQLNRKSSNPQFQALNLAPYQKESRDFVKQRQRAQRLSKSSLAGMEPAQKDYPLTHRDRANDEEMPDFEDAGGRNREAGRATDRGNLIS